ncbi:MAG: hypothetical protein E6Q90_10500 [Actinobacteria bacterium]|nr:MAG: hypothetical protein E6Q90_10500 [Actinomycetota bacterium]
MSMAPPKSRLPAAPPAQAEPGKPRAGRPAVRVTAVVAAAVAAVGLGYAALSSHTSASSPFATIATEQPVPEATGEWQRSDMTTLAPGRGEEDAVRSTAMAVSDGQLSKSLTASFRSAFGDDASVAVANLGGTVIWGYDGRGEAKAWSTYKPLVVAGLLAQRGGPGALTDEDRESIEAALEYSDNDSARLLLDELVFTDDSGAGALQLGRLLSAAGDTQTVLPNVAEGEDIAEMEWTNTNQVRFLNMLGSGCLLPKDSTEFLLGTMAKVTDEQRWGLGSVGSTAFKGGWDTTDEGDYLVRQFGIVPTSPGEELVVALTVKPRDSDPETANAMASDVAKWVVAHFKADAEEAVLNCTSPALASAG